MQAQANMTARALFSLDDRVLERFRALVPNQERSKAIEQFMRDEISRRENAREQRISKLAIMVESDPRFANVREVYGDVDQVAGEAVE